MRKSNHLRIGALVILCIFLFFINCSKKDSSSGTTTTTPPPPPPPPKSNEAKLTTFEFKKSFNPTLAQDVTGTINETSKAVTITLPAFTATNNLIASFTQSAKATVKVGSNTQSSGTTTNDFTAPLNYIVTAEDGTQQTYTVTTTVLKSDAAFITSLSFSKNTNAGIAKDIMGLITKDDKEIHLRNPYLSKSDFIANFTISPGATLKVNGVTQTSGVTSNNFSGDVTYEVTAASGKTNTYKIKTTPQILNFDEFIKECPSNDPNINQILTDFQIRIDGNLISSFSCNEPYYPMTAAQFTDQVKWLQTLRLLFYLDYGQANHLPWTNLRIYDWLKSKIGGINIVTGMNGGSCCNTFNGKPFINVGKLKGSGGFAEIPSLYYAWSMNNVVLTLHETRHLDTGPHTNCCPAGTGNCDNEYNEANLTPYAMHIWWRKAVLSRSFNFGFDCQSQSFIKDVIDGEWNGFGVNANNFCTPFTTPAKPAYWNDCKYK